MGVGFEVNPPDRTRYTAIEDPEIADQLTREYPFGKLDCNAEGWARRDRVFGVECLAGVWGGQALSGVVFAVATPPTEKSAFYREGDAGPMGGSCSR